ncbi:MAG: hypothetical protein K2X47_07770 [Bdellovibrionales bacterium]|nr:hypothetical protein [Bdellovibrionales bacterium]
MESWQGATKSDQEMYGAISLLFRSHPELLDFLFDKRRARLRLSPVEMLDGLRGFSGGEQVLIRVAMDLWSGCGNTKLSRMLETLDDESLNNVLNVLRILKRLPPAN